MPHSQLVCVELTSIRSDALPNGRKLLFNASFSFIGSSCDHFLVLLCHTIEHSLFFFSLATTTVCIKRGTKQSWQLGKDWFLLRLLVVIGVLFIRLVDSIYRVQWESRWRAFLTGLCGIFWARQVIDNAAAACLLQVASYRN